MTVRFKLVAGCGAPDCQWFLVSRGEKLCSDRGRTPSTWRGSGMTRGSRTARSRRSNSATTPTRSARSRRRVVALRSSTNGGASSRLALRSNDAYVRLP